MVLDEHGMFGRFSMTLSRAERYSNYSLIKGRLFSVSQFTHGSIKCGVRHVYVEIRQARRCGFFYVFFFSQSKRESVTDDLTAISFIIILLLLYRAERNWLRKLDSYLGQHRYIGGNICPRFYYLNLYFDSTFDL